jgi:hypothetical protein
MQKDSAISLETPEENVDFLTDLLISETVRWLRRQPILSWQDPFFAVKVPKARDRGRKDFNFRLELFSPYS